MAINGVYTQMEQRAVYEQLLAAGGVALAIAEISTYASTVYSRASRTLGTLFLFCGGHGDRCLVATSMVLNETDGSMLDEPAMLRGGVLAYNEVKTGHDSPLVPAAVPTAGSIWSTWDGAEQWVVDPLVSAATTPEAPDALHVANAAPILGIDVNGAYERARFRAGGYAAYALASPFNTTTLQLQLFIFHDKSSGAWRLGHVDANCEDAAAATEARVERCVASRSTLVLASAAADPTFPHLPVLACPGLRGGGLHEEGALRWHSAPRARVSQSLPLNLTVAASSPWCFAPSRAAGTPKSRAATRASGASASASASAGAAGAARAGSGWGAWDALRRATGQFGASTDTDEDSRYGSRDLLSWVLALTLGLSTFAAPLAAACAHCRACGKKEEAGRAKKKGKSAARHAAATGTIPSATATAAPSHKNSGGAARAASVATSTESDPINPRALQRHFGRGVVEMLTCPITKAVLVDPVRTPQGVAFGRAALEKRFGKSSDGAMICPVTKATITLRDVTSDSDLAAAIDIFGTLGRMLDAIGSAPGGADASGSGRGSGKGGRRSHKGKSSARR